MLRPRVASQAADLVGGESDRPDASRRGDCGRLKAATRSGAFAEGELGYVQGSEPKDAAWSRDAFSLPSHEPATPSLLQYGALALRLD